ncbi:MAG: PAS domain S-box protein [Polyangiaceae bacterium]|nr:PAS domain S-box protein [Polyangiaceae bacterium]
MDMQRDDPSCLEGEAAERLARALDLAGMMVIGLDAWGRVRSFSEEAERVTGFQRGEVLGKPFGEALLPPELRDDHGVLLRDMAAGRVQAERVLESGLRTRAGAAREVRWRLARMPAEDDERVALFAIGEDTTDTRAREAWVRRTEKLTAAGSLIAGLAHEIRNPLNGAHLHATLLERWLSRAGEGEAEALGAARVVLEELRRLSRLLSDFLDFARPQPLEPKAISLRGLCERALSAVRSEAEAVHAALEADVPEAEVEVELDPAKVELALVNLLRNGIEAVAPLGGGAVKLKARRRAGVVSLVIEDDGPGFPASDAPIFDPFFSTKPTGTGLGLAIVQRVASDHDGRVEVERRGGKTLFTMTLPARAGGGWPPR